MSAHWRLSWNTFHTRCRCSLRFQRNDGMLAIRLEQSSFVSQHLQKVTEVLNRIRSRTLLIHKRCCYWPSLWVLDHQNGLCPFIFHSVYRHVCVVTRYGRQTILTAGFFLPRPVLLSNTSSCHTVAAPCPVLDMSCALVLFNFCRCRVRWSPDLHRSCHFFNFEFYPKLLGSARWNLRLAVCGLSCSTQILTGRTYASVRCRPKPLLRPLAGASPCK